MQYFITEAQRKARHSTCYFEFQKGQKKHEYQPVFWKEDSLLLDDDCMNETGFYKIIPNFAPFGITRISKEAWRVMESRAAQEGGVIQEILEEFSLWAEKNFAQYTYFVILGI
jgi:hypothetical protein